MLVVEKNGFADTKISDISESEAGSFLRNARRSATGGKRPVEFDTDEARILVVVGPQGMPQKIVAVGMSNHVSQAEVIDQVEQTWKAFSQKAA